MQIENFSFSRGFKKANYTGPDGFKTEIIVINNR